MGGLTREWAVDAAERVAMTFLEAAAGILTVDLLHGAATGRDLLDVLTGAAIAGAAAAAAAVKTIAAGFLGHATSASLLPADLGPVGDPGLPFP